MQDACCLVSARTCLSGERCDPTAQRPRGARSSLEPARGRPARIVGTTFPPQRSRGAPIPCARGADPGGAAQLCAGCYSAFLMAYRLLALDLDGTLLRSDQRVDDRDVAAIAELQAAGVTVTIVTGRLHSGAIGAARACAIEGAIACVEGSHLVELASGRTLLHHGMPDDVAALVRAAFTGHGLDQLRVRRRRHPPRPRRRAVRAVRQHLVAEPADRRGGRRLADRPARGGRDRRRAGDRRGARGRCAVTPISCSASASRSTRAPASTRSWSAPPVRRRAPRSPSYAAAPAARSPRPSRSATGSTTCRCSRSPGRRSRWAARPTRCGPRPPMCSRSTAGSGGGIAEAIRRVVGLRRSDLQLRDRRGDPALVGPRRSGLRQLACPAPGAGAFQRA